MVNIKKIKHRAHVMIVLLGIRELEPGKLVSVPDVLNVMDRIILQARGHLVVLLNLVVTVSRLVIVDMNHGNQHVLDKLLITIIGTHTTLMVMLGLVTHHTVQVGETIQPLDHGLGTIDTIVSGNAKHDLLVIVSC